MTGKTQPGAAASSPLLAAGLSPGYERYARIALELPEVLFTGCLAHVVLPGCWLRLAAARMPTYAMLSR